MLRRRRFLIAVAVAFVLSVRAGRSADEFLSASRVGTISDARIVEVSGMVPVSDRPGHFWVHNDSKHGALIYAVRQDGSVVAEVSVSGAANSDWEDIARGPGPIDGRSYLYIADTGNNNRTRTDLRITRFPEPFLPHLGTGQRLTSAPAETIAFRYADGDFDAEALVVDPADGAIFVITKIGGTAGVYRLANDPSLGLQVATRVANVTTTNLITAADVSPDGARLLVRTYDQVLEYSLPAGAASFEAMFSRAPRDLPDASIETKSESICYDHGGREYLTTNESVPAPVHRFYCRVAQARCELAIAPDSPRNFQRGDLVEEGPRDRTAITIADAVALAAALDGAELDCADAGDIDDDGDLDRTDIERLTQSLAKGTSINVPYREPGLDTTSDELGCRETRVRRFVAADSRWRYAYGAAIAADWMTDPGFSILEGRGSIGFGAVDTPAGGQPGLSHTLYANTVFDVDELVDGLVLEIDYNDGFVAYLNGVEVARQRISDPGFVPPSELPAIYHLGGRFEDVAICADLLERGENVLAIEVHNRLLTDPTLFFAARLRGFDELEAAPVPSGVPPAGTVELRFEPEGDLVAEDSGRILVLADTGIALRGVSLSISADLSALRVRSIEPGPAFAGRAATSYAVSSFLANSGFAMTLDAGAPAIGPGESIPVAILNIDTEQAGTTRLRFLDRLTTSIPVRTLVATEDGQTRIPRLEDIDLEIARTRGTRIESVVPESGVAGDRVFVVGDGFDALELAVRVCGRDAEFETLDFQTLRVVIPECAASGWVPLEVCSENGCARLEQGFSYRDDESRDWIRGDANGDTLVDISDGISLLGHLFLGAEIEPRCPTAPDANADGAIDVSDAVFVLAYLFQGGAIIPAPYPQPAACAAR